jgi:NitT/TauT family transport system substrate-binding protein
MGRLAAASFGLMLAFAGGVATADSPAHLAVGYTNTISFIGLFIAKDQGMFVRHGLNVDLVLIALNSTIPSALVGGSIQIGGPSPPVLLQAVEGGLDLVVVAGARVNDVRNKAGAGVVARMGANIKGPKDFEGKRVGVPGIGANMHVLFRRWLVQHGADDRKVNFVEVPFAQGSDILKSGNIDAVLEEDPFYSRIIKANTGYLVSAYLAEMPDGLFSTYYAATRTWASTHGGVIEAFRAALAEARDYQAKEPANSRQILGRAMRLPPEVAASIALPTLKLGVPLSDLEYWSATLHEQGVIKAQPEAARLLVH